MSEFWGQRDERVWLMTILASLGKIVLIIGRPKALLLYGSESWKVTATISKKTQTFVNKCQILHLKWFDRVPNTVLWTRTTEEPMVIQIRRRKWRWVGHTLRKEPFNITRRERGNEGVRSRHGGEAFTVNWAHPTWHEKQARCRPRTEGDGRWLLRPYVPPGEKMTKTKIGRPSPDCLSLPQYDPTIFAECLNCVSKLCYFFEHEDALRKERYLRHLKNICQSTR